MELPLTLARLRKRKQYYTLINSTEVIELSVAINTHGLKAVREYIKATLGKPCPTIIQVWSETDTNYYFKKYCKQAYINEELVWITLGQYLSHLAQARDIGTYNQYYSYERQEELLINGVTRLSWILLGEECPTCNLVWIRRTSSTACPECAKKYSTRAYNHRVEEELGFETKKERKYFAAPRFGIELEYEQLTAAEVFQTLEGHALPKSDGSIHSGVEIVTRPAYMDTHKEKLANFYAKTTVQAASNTGMHVHIEKEGLSDYQIGFITEFLNSTELLPKTELVAGRKYSANTYCKPNPVRKLTTGLEYDFETKKLYREATPKYSPLNTSKPKTVEIRIFSSPVSAEECFAKLDFVAALVQYSSPYSVHVKHLRDKFQWDNFIAFIAANKKEFKDFHSYYVKTGKL